jgi:hypothetical protein
VLFEIFDRLEMAVLEEFEVAGGELMHGILLAVGDSNIHDDNVGMRVDGGCRRVRISGLRRGE